MMSTVRLWIAVPLATVMLLAASEANARDGFRNLYGGLGLFRSMAQYSSESAESSFNGWGASIVAGFGVPFGTSSGAFLEGEYGRVDALNTLQSTTYMEKSVNTFMAGKLGFTFDMFGIGGGAQQNAIDVDNVATIGTSGRSSYKGLNYFGFVRLTVESKDSFHTILEAKYGNGTFSGLEMSETTLSLRFVFLPF